jgi:hypothetical protein
MPPLRAYVVRSWERGRMAHGVRGFAVAGLTRSMSGTNMQLVTVNVHLKEGDAEPQQHLDDVSARQRVEQTSEWGRGRKSAMTRWV